MLPLLAAVGCAPRVPLAPPPPEVRVPHIRVASASSERADLAMELQVRNPSDEPVSFSGLTYFLSVNGSTFFTGKPAVAGGGAPTRDSEPGGAFAGSV